MGPASIALIFSDRGWTIFYKDFTSTRWWCQAQNGPAKSFRPSSFCHSIIHPRNPSHPWSNSLC